MSNLWERTNNFLKRKAPVPDRPKKMVPELSKLSGTKLKKALLIGFNMYYSSWELGGVPNKEIAFIEALLKKIAPNCQIRIIVESEFNAYSGGSLGAPSPNGVTVAKVREAMDWLSAGIGPGDSVYFHYSGHGTIRDDTKAHPIPQAMIDQPYLSWPYLFYSSIYMNPPFDTEMPPNPKVNDEPKMLFHDYPDPVIRSRGDFAIIVPEYFWMTDQYWYEIEAKKLHAIGNFEPGTGIWGRKAGTEVIIRDDEIRSRIVDKIPKGAKCFMFFAACTSQGATDLKYEWDLVAKDANGNNIVINPDNITNYDQSKIGMKYDVTKLNYNDTRGDIVVISGAIFGQSTYIYNNDTMTAVTKNFLDSWESQIISNILHGKSRSTVINLKKLYYTMLTKSDPISTPTISTGKNMLCEENNNIGTSFVETDDNGYYYDDNFGIEITDNGNTIKVNDVLVSETKQNINESVVFIIQNYNGLTKTNKTLVIDNKEYDIISQNAGQGYIIGRPLLFDLCN